MPKLYYRYGTMGASKSANLIMTVNNYKSIGRKVGVLKPSTDTRTTDTVSSRTGMSTKIDILLDSADDVSFDPEWDALLVDECQFLQPFQIDQLRALTRKMPVICYGLRTDYTSHAFPGSLRLLEIADSIEEIKMLCTCCDRKAVFNAMYSSNSDGTFSVITTGDSSPVIAGEELFKALCWECYTKYSDPSTSRAPGFRATSTDHLTKF